MNTTINNDDNVNNDEIILTLFDHAMKTMQTDHAKHEAHRLMKLYTGEETQLDSLSTMIMHAFVCGLDEGLRFAAVMHDGIDLEEQD